MTLADIPKEELGLGLIIAVILIVAALSQITDNKEDE